jgi:hypothetical protein
MAEVAQFAGMIGPANLAALVRNTAPWLFREAVGAPDDALAELAERPRGWEAIVRRAEAPGWAPSRDDYFILCLACHHATVATYIPTDVDAKIRGVLWSTGGAASVHARTRATVAARGWDLAGASARTVAVAEGRPISGHDGEVLSVLAGALAAHLRTGDAAQAEEVAAVIDAELDREARAFDEAVRRPGRELDVLRLAVVLTHNAGDMDQGISFWSEDDARLAPFRARFHRLAHENAAPYRGAFQLAALVYREAMAAEGHRNYPLRAVKPLRLHPDLLLPIAPFLEDWGRVVATHPALTMEGRAEVVAALLSGCRKIPGQVGYYRALAGLVEALSGPLDQLIKHLPGALRSGFKDPEVRRHLALKQSSFASAMGKKAAALTAGRRQR